MVKIIGNHILNDDESYLTPDQIVTDLLYKQYDKETEVSILNDFNAPKDADRHERFAYAFGRMEFGRWIRNTYGLWREDNPYVVLNPPPDGQGIVVHPQFPDNLSGDIIDRFIKEFKTLKQPSNFEISGK